MDHQEHKTPPNSVELPTPTAWPIVTAFGLTLVFLGLVTSLIISLVGLITGLIGAFGWCFDVFPHPRHEAVPLLPESERASVKVSPRSVGHLQIGEKGHRVRLPVEIHPYSAGVKGGLAGAVVMAILACIYGLWKQDSIWYPINLLAAAGVPELATGDIQTLRQFSMVGLIVASIAHLSMSILVGLLYSVILPMLPAKYEWFWGGIMTPLMWTGIVFASLGAINPVLAALIDWPWFILCQVAFGLVGGYVVFKTAKIETMQNWPLAAKLGVEAQMPEERKKP